MNLHSISEDAQKVVLKAGAYIAEMFLKKEELTIEEKHFNNLVSQVDREAERLLVEGLLTVLPESGIMAEEETVKYEQKDYTWIIDPLDGTTNFLFGVPSFAVSVALQYKAETVIGIVYEVNRKELFTAIKGEGAFLNAKALQMQNKTDLKAALLSTGFPYYDFEHTEAYLKILESFMLGSKGLRRLGAAAVDLCYVASGIYDGFFEYSLHPWDVAAGALIVEEAGGIVTDYKGGNDFIHGQRILAASPGIHEEMLKVIKEHFIE